MRKKVIDQTNISENNKKKLENDISPDFLGVANDKLVEPIPNFINAPCEKIIQGENNTWIVFGRDRPAGILSGYGGQGHTGCGTIDIVAGRMSSNIKTEGVLGSKVIPIYTDNNIIRDASRILVSQKTDVDKNFKISESKSGKTNSKAAIAIKSDHIRLIARETMKLVTGTDSKNSRSAPLVSIPGIELIAGNDASTLEPIPKGDQLLLALKAISEQVDKLTAVVDSFLTYQLEFNSVIMQHTHPEPLSMFIGVMATGNPLEITNGRDLPSPEVLESGLKTTTSLLCITKKDLITIKVNLANLQLNYFEQFGKSYINSRYNKVN